LYLYEPPADTVFAYAGEDEISVDVDGFNTNKLILTFDLINATEIYDEIIVSLSKADSEGTYLYSDLYPNEEIDILDVDAGRDRTVKVNQSVQFTGTASGGTAPYEWEWYFDEDEFVDSTDQNPTFTFTEPGTYNVELNVYDSEAGVGIAYVTVTVAGSNGGNGNGGITPSDSPISGLTIFIILIVIIIVVAVAVVVYVIKK
jgi:PKD repeat protein